jgi:hypothetical protein
VSGDSGVNAKPEFVNECARRIGSGEHEPTLAATPDRSPEKFQLGDQAFGVPPLRWGLISHLSVCVPSCRTHFSCRTLGLRDRRQTEVCRLSRWLLVGLLRTTMDPLTRTKSRSSKTPPVTEKYWHFCALKNKLPFLSILKVCMCRGWLHEAQKARQAPGAETRIPT